MTAIDGDARQRDLYTAIEEGDDPSWTLKVQLMPFEDAKTYRFNPFDVTKVWPHGDYPVHEVVLEGVTEPILQRAFEYWRNVDKDLGERIEQGVRAGQSRPDRSADAKGAHVSPRRLLLHDPAQRRTKCGEPFGGS
jgi:catalase